MAEVITTYPDQLPIGNPRQSLPPADAGHGWQDPTQYIGSSSIIAPRVSQGAKKQPNFKVVRDK